MQASEAGELMKEIGGYMDCERFSGKLLHDDGILLNCGRNCLAFLIMGREVRLADRQNRDSVFYVRNSRRNMFKIRCEG